MEKYKVGSVTGGEMFDAGYRFAVIGPGGANFGYYKADEEDAAERKAQQLNAEASRQA
jgi:hypothetical protein